MRTVGFQRLTVERKGRDMHVARKRVVFTAVTAAALILSLGWAHAGVSDGVPATESNINDVLSSTVHNATLDLTTNISCTVSATGGPLIQHTDIIVGDLFPRDFAEGDAECVDLQRSAFSGTLYVDIEYFTGSSWAAVGGTIKSEFASSHAGIAAFLPLITQGIYSTFPNTYLNRYHRGHAELLLSDGSRRDAYSHAVWFMAP